MKTAGRMEFAAHTYGPSCILHHDSNADVHRPLDAPPPLKSFFFYSSLLPIDDPLSPLPPPSASVNARLPIRPFSAYDNAMLEEAWRGLDTTPKSGNTPLAPPPGEQGPSSEPQPSLAIDDYNDKRGSRILSSRQKKKRKLSQTSGGDVVEDLQHGGKRGLGLSFPQPSSQGTVTPAYPLRSKSGSKASKKARDTSPRGGDEERFEHRDVTSQTVMPERNFMAGSGLESAGSSFGIGDEGASSRKSKNTLHGDIEQSSIMQFQQEPTPDEPALLCDYPNHERDQDGPVTLDELESEVSLVKKGKQPQFSKDKPNKKTPSPRDLNPIEITSPLALPQTKTVQTAQIPYGSSPAERDTTGNPFQRALSRPKVPRFLKTKALQQKDGPSSESEDDPEQLPQHLSALLSSRGTRHAYTPVGVSRLHLVEMPELEVSLKGVTLFCP